MVLLLKNFEKYFEKYLYEGSGSGSPGRSAGRFSGKVAPPLPGSTTCGLLGSPAAPLAPKTAPKLKPPAQVQAEADYFSTQRPEVKLALPEELKVG